MYVLLLCLEQIGKLEKYSPDVQMVWILIRTLFVRLLSIGFAGFKFYTATYCAKLDNTCGFCENESDPIAKRPHREKEVCWESVFGSQIYM
jgi:hypothetical protein